jgi:hypothetical protein
MNRDTLEGLGLAIDEDRQKRATIALRDVAYVIEAHFDLTVRDERVLTLEPVIGDTHPIAVVLLLRRQLGEAGARARRLKASAPNRTLSVERLKRSPNRRGFFHDYEDFPTPAAANAVR